MFYRILAALVAVALIYITYEIIATHSYYKFQHTPAAPFMAMNETTGTIPVVQYIDFSCKVCKDNTLVMMDFAEKNPDIKFILRPVFDNSPEQYDQVRTAIATGLQNRYWETMRAISQYDGIPDRKFYEDNASLIDLDMTKLEKDVFTEAVEKITQDNIRAVNAAQFESTQSLSVDRKLYYLTKPLTEADLSQMVEAERQSRR